MSTTDIDSKTMCSLTKAPSLHEVAHVDLTTKWQNEQEPQYVKNEIQKKAEALPVGGRLAVNIIVADDDGRVVLRSVFDKCRPRDGSEVSAIDHNIGKMRLRYEEEFVGALATALKTLDETKDAQFSPLLELFALHDPFPAVKKLQAPQRRLTIVSDLLQKSEALDMYSTKYNFPPPEKLFIKNVQNQLKGVEVTVMLRDNKEARQFLTEKHRKFWEQYFGSEVAGAAKYDVMTM